MDETIVGFTSSYPLRTITAKAREVILETAFKF